MKKYIIGTVLVCVGIILSFPLFSISYYTMVRTSTPRFCASCHEIQPAYNAWKTSTHVNNAQGFVADCMDCHLPAPHDTFNFFYAIFLHFFGGKYDREKNRLIAYATFKNEQCRKCHRNILYIPNNRGAMLAHRDVIYARPGYEKRCVDCHKNLVHVPRPYYQYKQYRDTYRGVGL